MLNIFLSVKLIHIASVICWMGALFYLPRIFVYHAMHDSSSKTAKQFEVMERRLSKVIMIPSMVATWISGIWLSILANSFSYHWLSAKMSLVILLSIFSFYLIWCMKNFRVGKNTHSSKYFRVINELPTVLMIFILYFVVFKPVF